MRTTSLLSGLALALALAPCPMSAQDAAATADGARVWANQCTRCHNARPSQERTDAQWQTIVLHMRARANLTRADARLVTSFLQATNFPEHPVTVPVAAEREAETPEDATPIPEEGSSGSAPAAPERRPTVLMVGTYLFLLGLP